MSEEELLNNRSIVPFQQTSQSSLDKIWEGSQNDTIYNDLSEGGKKMTINENPENHSPVAVSDIPDGESPIPEANSQHIDFPVLELDDDNDIDLDSVQWDVIEASVSSRLSTPSSISHRQSLFKSDMGTIFFFGFLFIIHFSLSRFLYFAASTSKAKLHHFEFSSLFFINPIPGS